MSPILIAMWSSAALMCQGILDSHRRQHIFYVNGFYYLISLCMSAIPRHFTMHMLSVLDSGRSCICLDILHHFIFIFITMN